MDRPGIADIHEIFHKYAQACVELTVGDREIRGDIETMTEGWSDEQLRWALGVLCGELKRAGKKILKESCPPNARGLTS